jgi:twitching motility protein PilT
MELDSLLSRAIDAGATDVHLKVGGPPRIRTDGRLRPLEDARLDEADLTAVVEQVCAASPGRRETLVESGELDIAYTGGGSRFRVNGYRQRGTFAFVFRRIPNEAPTLEQLTLPVGVRRLVAEHHGLILVTGPTGSGKSTTLAAMIDEINRTREQHVVTIEDPIEVLHRDQKSSVSQREVGLDTRSFSEALRRALRQDPDVILIGEMRDAETTETALHAAESGHLVLSTMHTVNAAETIGRMIEFFPAIKQAQIRSIVAGVLKGVVSQRLLPKIGGGVVAAVEVMAVNERISDLIREDRADEITDAIREGTFFAMQTFEQALLGLVADGVVERETAANVAMDRHDFALALDHELKRRAASAADAAAEAASADAPEPQREPAAGTSFLRTG